MTDRIEPALDEEAWMYARRSPNDALREQFRDPYTGDSVGPPDLPAVIALANAALPDSDPRRITREWVEDLRAMADDAESIARLGGQTAGDEDVLRAIAAALESYLPPE